MSLVVLRSWTDGPPKVRGIAPSESNEKYVYVPDHRGQFVTEEVVTLRPQNDQKVKAGAIRRQTWNGDRSHNDEDGVGNNGPNHIATVKETIRMHEADGDDEEDYNYGNNAAEHERSSSIGAKINGGAGVCRRRVGGSGSDCKSTERNYKSLSYIDLNSEERVEHISKSTTTTTETIATSKNRWANETRKPALLKPNKPAELQQRAPSRSSSISPGNSHHDNHYTWRLLYTHYALPSSFLLLLLSLNNLGNINVQEISICFQQPMCMLIILCDCLTE